LSPSGNRRGALRVLLVTASDEELRAYGGALHRERLTVTRARDAAGAVEALHDGAFDVAIVSHPLPDADVIASCASLRQVPGAPPVILLDALDPGAQTFPAAIRPARMLRKPVEAAKLGALVREVAEGAEPADEPAAEPGTATLALAAALLQLSSARETGVLDVRSNTIRTRIFLQEGVAVSTEGGSLRETLGRMLLRRGELAEADYVRVIERMTEQVMANEHQRMGEVLVELGLLSHEDVHRALAAQCLEKVTACFGWANATWTFSELDALPDELEPFELPPMEQLVLAGLREYASPPALVAWLAPHAAARPRLQRPLAELTERLQLDPATCRKLEGFDGSRALAVVLSEDTELPALVATLLLLDALALGSGGAQAERAKEPRVAFARDVVRPRVAPASPPAAAEAAPANPAHARLEAEQCFRRAQQLLATEKSPEALKLLRRAVELEPEEPEYAMVEAWISYLDARQAVRVARARASAAARRQLEANPKTPRLHTILGRLALDDGDRGRATREFEVALMQDPQDEEAKRSLKQARKLS
jgi:DNA-binding response OmpR family regulator/Flp pilus assembly protein TadD